MYLRKKSKGLSCSWLYRYTKADKWPCADRRIKESEGATLMELLCALRKDKEIYEDFQWG